MRTNYENPKGDLVPEYDIDYTTPADRLDFVRKCAEMLVDLKLRENTHIGIGNQCKMITKEEYESIDQEQFDTLVEKYMEAALSGKDPISLLPWNDGIQDEVLNRTLSNVLFDNGFCE